jgi:hypothetical protein
LATKLSFENVRAIFSHNFSAKRDIQILPGMIVDLLPVSALTNIGKEDMKKIVAAIVTFLLLEFNTVHWAHETEGSLVQDVVDRLARLIVSRFKDANDEGPNLQLEVGTSALPSQRPLKVLDITGRVQSKLTQTRQNVREVPTSPPTHVPLRSSRSRSMCGCALVRASWACRRCRSSAFWRACR